MEKEPVLITGGACGIGAAAAERCCREGFDVVAIHRADDDIIADLSSPSETARALQQALNAVGPGPIATKLFHQVNPPASPRTQAIIDSVPVRRLGHSGRDHPCGGMTIGVGPL